MGPICKVAEALKPPFNHAEFERCAARPGMLKDGMDKTIRKYTDPNDFEELKAEEYRYWQSRPVHERVAAVFELSQEHYTLKGEAPDVPGLQRTLVRFERAPR
jgi:hypothetical protein